MFQETNSQSTKKLDCREGYSKYLGNYSPDFKGPLNKLNSVKEIKFLNKQFNKITRAYNKLHSPNKKVIGYTNSPVPMLKVVIGNKNCQLEALLDSGACCEIMSKQLYESLVKKKDCSKLHSCDGNLIAANNEKLNILGYCYTKLRVSNFTWKVKFVVITDISCDLVLGTPFISKTKLLLDLSNNCCYFKFKPEIKLPVGRVHLAGVQSSSSNIRVGCDEVRPQIEGLINKYPNVFTSKIGEALDLEVKLNVIDSQVVNIRPYFASPPVVQKMKGILDDWVHQGIIKPSTSAYSSPAFLTKKDRLVINYTELNKKLEKMMFPIGDLSNYYQHLSGSRWFTIIDLNKSFLQCKIAEESQYLTAFSTIYGKYAFTRVPFGLHIGSAVLASYMDRVLHEVKFKWALNFADDILIFSKDLKSHLKHVDDVLNRLSKHNLTANLSKARFCCKEISFLGNLIKNNSITIDPERTKTLREFKPPRNARQVSQFLGMTGFFSKFINNYAEICLPLNKLRKKGTKFIWSEKCQESFQKLKDCISNPPVLQIANFQKPFILMTDASAAAAGGCLLQENDHGDLLPIAYYSKKFNECEMRYTVYEKEALAVILCIEKWHEFLELRSFKLITDNQALSYVLDHKRKVGRLGRWVERILNLPFTVEFTRSEDNKISDALSRMFESENIENTNSDKNALNAISETNADPQRKKHCSESSLKPPACKQRTSQRHKAKDCLWQLICEIPLAFKDLKKFQAEDVEIQNIIRSINDGTNNKSLYLSNDVLMHKKKENCKGKIFLPKMAMDLIFDFFHNSILGGHNGILRTQRKVNQYFFRPDLNEFIRNKVKDCLICKMSKTAQRKYEGQLVSVPIESTMNCLFLDLVGPLVRSKNQNQYLLVAVDGFSKFVWVVPLRDCKTKNITDKLEQVIFNNFSVPKIIVSDNASYFCSIAFKKFLFKNYIEHRRIAAYRPSGNQAERNIRNLTTLLRSFYHNCQTDWDKDLPYVQLSLNTAVHESTQFSAFQLMFNHSANNALSNIWKLNDLLDDKLSVEEAKNNLSKALNNVKKSVAHNRNRAKYNENNVKHPFTKNSLVLVKTHFLSSKIKQFTAKLAPKYEGLYRIIYFLTPVTCLVQHVDDIANIKKVHIIDLKLYK